MRKIRRFRGVGMLAVGIALCVAGNMGAGRAFAVNYNTNQTDGGGSSGSVDMGGQVVPVPPDDPGAGGGGASPGASSGTEEANPGKCTSILIFLEDSCKNDTDGKGITGILNVVLAILTAGVGVAATLGIVISGIQYMTARDNEDQAKKARKRIFEVVIGVAVYAVMWLALQWLLPGGVLGE